MNYTEEPGRCSRPGSAATTPHHEDPATTDPTGHVPSSTDLSAVDWYAVALFVAPLLQQVGRWPAAGSPAWCDLEETDPRKVAAVYDAARRWALQVDGYQVARRIALAEASREISAAYDWKALARKIQEYNEFRAERPWMNRHSG